MSMFNLLDQALAGGNAADQNKLSLLHLDENQRAIVIFTAQCPSVTLHWVDGECRGFFVCNEKDCIACRAGRKSDKKFLLPVYDPATRSVMVLPVGMSMRPHALLPQLVPVLQCGTPMVTLINSLGARTGRYKVESSPVPKDMDAAPIAAFSLKYPDGQFPYGDLYPSISNEQLLAIPEIAAVLKLKGISA
jgi:hypothetical protein